MTLLFRGPESHTSSHIHVMCYKLGGYRDAPHARHDSPNHLSIVEIEKLPLFSDIYHDVISRVLGGGESGDGPESRLPKWWCTVTGAKRRASANEARDTCEIDGAQALIQKCL